MKIEIKIDSTHSAEQDFLDVIYFRISKGGQQSSTDALTVEFAFKPLDLDSIEAKAFERAIRDTGAALNYSSSNTGEIYANIVKKFYGNEFKNSEIYLQYQTYATKLQQIGISSFVLAPANHIALSIVPTDFINYYNKKSGVTTPNNRVTVKFDRATKSLSRVNSDGKILSCGFDGKRGLILSRIIELGTVAGKKLNKNLQSVSTEIKSMNGRATKVLGLSSNLIVNHGGYSIDTNLYKIDIC